MNDQEVRRAILKQIRESDETLMRIAVQFGYAGDIAIRRIAQDEGIDLAARLNSQRQAKNAMIKDALADTSNAAHVARRLGFSRPTIHRIAKKEGIELTAGHAAKGRRLSPATPTKEIEAPNAHPIRGAPSSGLG